MRKSSRILSILLVVCLLICATVVAASASNAANESQNAAVIEFADGTKREYGLDDVDVAIAAIEAMSADELSSAKIFLHQGVLDTDKLAEGAELMIFVDGSAEVTGGEKYRLRLLDAEGDAKCYVVDCLTVEGEGITPVKLGKGSFGNTNNATNSGLKSETGTMVSGGIINDYTRVYATGEDSFPTFKTFYRIQNNLSVNVSAFDYTVLDFDFASDKYVKDGKLSDDGTTLAYYDGLQFRLDPSSGTGSNFTMFYVVSNNGYWYASADNAYDSSDIFLAQDAGVWNHATVVIDSNGVLYLFIDGQYLTSAAFANNIWRIVFNCNKATYTAFSLAIDNVSINTYALGGDYALDALFTEEAYKTTPLYNVDGIIYNKNYKYYGCPDGQYAATVTDKDGNGKGYFFLEDALANLAEGATIESRKNVPAIDPDDAIQSYTVITKFGTTMANPSDKYYRVSNTVDGATTTYVLTRLGEDELVMVDWEICEDRECIFGSEQTPDVKGEELTVPDEFLAKLEELSSDIKGDCKWMIDMGDSIIFADDPIIPRECVNKNVTVRIATISVTWLDTVGGIYATEDWFAGNEITSYDISALSNVEVTGNGWYNMDYTTWESEGKDMLDNVFVAEAFTPLTFTPKKTPIPAVTDVKLNMSLLTKFEANLYITNRPLENITLGGIYSDVELLDNIVDMLKTAELEGNAYYLDNFFFDNSDVDKVVSRFVQYTVVYEGGEITLVDEIQVSLLDYAEKVLAQYACGSEEANLAYNLINYANAAYALKTGSDYDAAIAFLALEGHEEGCACSATYDYAAEEVCYIDTTLGENVFGWTFDVSNEQPGFVVFVKVDEFDNALVEDIELAFYGIDGTEVGDVAVKLVRGENVEIGDAVYATFFFEDMPLYNAAEIFTLTVIDATTGEVYVANYSLATYIDYAMNPEKEMDPAALNVAEALYSFAKAAKEYKLN